MKTSDEMKDRIKKIHGILNSEEIFEDYNVECMFLREKKDLEEYLPKVEALEKENDLLKKALEAISNILDNLS